MKNYLWVIEFNGHPKELKTSWTPIIANPEWNREWARSELKDRAKETKYPTKHYRIRKYVSEL